MSKPFFEVFPSLQLNTDIRDLMGQTEVERVSATKRRDFLRVYLKSTRLIQKADIWTTEQEIKKQLFPQANLTVKIYEKFELSSQYNPEKLMDIYKESILEEFREYSHIQYNALKTAKIEYPSENEMLLTLEDTVLNHSMEGEILQILEKILVERCGFSVKIHTAYVEKETGRFQEEEEAKIRLKVVPFTVVRKAEEKKESRLHRRKEAGKVQHRIRKPARLQRPHKAEDRECRWRDQELSGWQPR